MLIKAISVEGVGRFANAAHIDGFGSGVNVLAAGNEVGKSTLFRMITGQEQPDSGSITVGPSVR